MAGGGKAMVQGRRPAHGLVASEHSVLALNVPGAGLARPFLAGVFGRCMLLGERGL
jgi:hypothetical protein